MLILAQSLCFQGSRPAFLRPALPLPAQPGQWPKDRTFLKLRHDTSLKKTRLRITLVNFRPFTLASTESCLLFTFTQRTSYQTMHNKMSQDCVNFCIVPLVKFEFYFRHSPIRKWALLHIIYKITPT